MKSIKERYICITESAAGIFNNWLLTSCCFLAYKGILDIIYFNYVGDSFSFFGISIAPLNVACGWLITLIMSFAVYFYYQQNTASAVMMVIFNMIYFIPMTTYCSYGGGSASFLFWGILYWTLLTLLQLGIPVIVWNKERTTENGEKYIWLLSILVSIPVIYVWAKYTGFRLLMNFSEIYQIRAEAAGYAIPVVLRYILSMVPIIIALLIVLAMKNKQYIPVIYLLIVTFINFSIAGHKSVILFPVILIGGFLLYRREMISVILPAGIILELAAIAENYLGRGLIINYIIRRQGFMLAQLSEYYYRFFRYNSTDLFRQGVIGKLGFDTIYSQKIVNVIGNNFETQAVNCNNGLMADAWANLGIIGIIVMPIIMVYCMRLLDFASHRIDVRLIIGIVAYYALSFANSQWSTVLLTHGFILMCLLLLFFPREQKEQKGDSTLT